jgi:hypothetical protein
VRSVHFKRALLVWARTARERAGDRIANGGRRAESWRMMLSGFSAGHLSAVPTA